MTKRDEITQRMNELKKKYAAAHQEQVFDHAHDLNEVELKELYNDLQSVDPEEVNYCYQRTISNFRK